MADERYAPPGEAAQTPPGQPVEYVGFWARVGAALIDSVGLLLFIVLMMEFLYGHASGRGHDGDLMSITVNYILPAVAVLAFWIVRGATPGKMAISAVIVDAKTLAPPSRSQFVARYLGYYVSTIPLGLGLLWVGFDARKQGWHDKIANTVVIRRPR